MSAQVITPQVEGWQRPRPVAIPDGRLPPHDLDLEATVLGVCLYDPATARRLAETLTPEDLYSEPHRVLWEAVQGVLGEGLEPTAEAVMAWLRRRDRHLKIPAGLPAQLIDGAPASTPNLGDYVRQVRDLARLRRLARLADRVRAECYVGQPDPQAFLDRALQELEQLARLAAPERMERNRDTLMALIGQLKERAKTGNIVTGVPTGLSAYDQATAGLHPGQVTLLGGRTSIGKSAMALGWALHAAARGIGALYVSVEMSRSELLTRAMGLLGRVEGERLRSPSLLGFRDWERLQGAAVKLSTWPLHIVDRAYTLEQIWRSVVSAMEAAHARGAPIGVVFIDHVHGLSPSKGEERADQRTRLERRAQRLKRLAEHIRAPVVGLVQLGRGAEDSKKPERPTLRHIEGADALGQWADAIALIHRPSYYETHKEDDGRAEIVIAKQRSGPRGRVIEVRFEPALMRFCDADEPRGAFDDL